MKTPQLPIRSFCLFILFLLAGSLSAFAQQIIRGKVLDEETKEPLIGVAVYLSGTSTGVVTGMDGSFSLSYDKALNAAVVFSYLGYEKVNVLNPLTEDLTTVYLKPSQNILDPVTINPDPWDRATKEKIFLRYFVGKLSMEHCKVLNLKDVKLRFNTDSKLLTATSRNPIQLVNNYLGYVISYDLSEFEVEFDYLRGEDAPLLSFEAAHSRSNYLVNQTFIAGNAFYRELQGKGPSERRRAKRREKAFELSQLKLHRSIINETLEENDFTLVYNCFKVDPKKHIRVRNSQGVYKVTFRHLKYTILDGKDHQTDMYLNSNYVYFNDYGIILSPREVRFSGYIPDLGIGGMMPLDYDYQATPVKQ